MLAADSDESYAKQTLGIGSKLNSGHEKVLGLSWDIESDNFIFQFSKLADAAEKVNLTKRNTELACESVRPYRVDRAYYNSHEDVVPTHLPRKH